MSLYPPPGQDPSLTPEQLVGDPEYFLPQTQTAPEKPLHFSGISPAPMGQLPLTGAAKYAGQFVRGASLGLLGDPEAPEGVGQHIAEMGGMVLPGAALSAVTGPAAAALPLLRTFPIVARTAIAEATAGALTGAAHAGFTGGDVTQETLLGGITGAAAGAGWAAWAKKARGASAPEHIKEAIQSHAMRELPPGPPGLGAGQRGDQITPAYQPPPYGRASARVISNEPVSPFPGAQVPTPETAYPVPLGPRVPGALPEGPGGMPALEAPRLPVKPTPPEQLYMPDLGATQLRLPMDIVPNGRMNRYATPSRYKGTYETAELASSEANIIAQTAIREGAQTVRVTTTIQPRTGPPIGGSIRVYAPGPNGAAQLVSERTINMGAIRAASVGAMPMRRMIPDYFEVVYNPKLNSDILIPVNKEVEQGLRIALGVEPHQASFPMSPEQLSFLNSIEGRTIRQKMDIGTMRLSLEDVMAMDEQAAKRVLVDAMEAPPAMAGAVIKASDDAIRARELLANLEVGNEELNAFLGTLKGLRNPKDRFNRTLAWLQSKCGGL